MRPCRWVGLPRRIPFVRRIRLRCRVRIGAVLVRTPRQGQGRGDAGGHPAERRMNRTIMQTDPTARHSPIGLFRRVCYLARAQCLPGQPRHPRRLYGHQRPQMHRSPPTLGLFLGEPLTAGASRIARKAIRVGCRSPTMTRVILPVGACRSGAITVDASVPPWDRLVGFMSPAAASPSSEREPPTDSTLHRCVRLTGRGMPPPLRH